MKDLKFTTLEDITEFLKKFDYIWLGTIHARNNLFGLDGTTSRYSNRKAKIQDFENNKQVSLKVYKNKLENTKPSYLTISVSDLSFYIQNEEVKDDLSTIWQSFMLERKYIEYAKFICSETNKAIKKIKLSFNEETNLIKKKIQQLEYEKNLKLAKLNTNLINAKNLLSNQEVTTNKKTIF